MSRPSAHRWSLGLLLLTTLIWGTTFPIIKDTVSTLSPAALIGSRFLIAALLMAPFCWPLNRKLIRDGAILGSVAFLAYLTQAVGLELTTSNRAAFITSLNVILVPIIGRFLGRTISVRILVAAGLAFLGIGIMSWEGGAWSWGDAWVFGCAISYAIYILLMEALVPKHPPLALTAMQLLVIAVLGGVWALPSWLSQPHAIGDHWQAIVYLGVVATAVTTLSQVIAQRHLSATETAIIYTLEPVFAAVFAFWWLSESLGLRGLLGAGMVLIAMLLSQLKANS